MFTQNNGMIASERPKYWQSKLFTTSGTWTVPSDVGVIWVDGCGGGGGGGGGNATPGGGGGGGGSAIGVAYAPVGVTPGESLTLVIGEKGTGGNAGSNGVLGNQSSLANAGGMLLALPGGGYGGAGANPNGGYGGQYNFNSTVVGGAGAGSAVASTSLFVTANAPGVPLGQYYKGSSGAAGGALSFGGGAAYGGSPTNPYGNVSAAGNASGGGGGSGGHCTFGSAGAGGANGAAGSNATGYGAGGGGGSGNAAGGNGSPGFIRIYCFSATTI